MDSGRQESVNRETDGNDGDDGQQVLAVPLGHVGPQAARRALISGLHRLHALLLRFQLTFQSGDPLGQVVRCGFIGHRHKLSLWPRPVNRRSNCAIRARRPAPVQSFPVKPSTAWAGRLREGAVALTVTLNDPPLSGGCDRRVRVTLQGFPSGPALRSRRHQPDGQLVPGFPPPLFQTGYLTITDGRSDGFDTL